MKTKHYESHRKALEGEGPWARENHVEGMPQLVTLDEADLEQLAAGGAVARRFGGSGSMQRPAVIIITLDDTLARPSD